jgi:hypothetical protein
VIQRDLQNAAEFSVAFFFSKGSGVVTRNLIIDTKGVIAPMDDITCMEFICILKTKAPCQKLDRAI